MIRPAVQSVPSCGDLLGLSFAHRCKEFCHRLDLHIAVLQLPFVVLFQQHRADQSDDRCFVGEYADNVGASLHFLVQSLQRIRAVDLGPVLLGEVQMRQNVGLAVVNERRELRPFLPQLVRHVT